MKSTTPPLTFPALALFSCRRWPSSAGHRRRIEIMRLFMGLNLGCAAMLALGCGSGSEQVSLDWRVNWYDAATGDFTNLKGATVCVDDHPEVECQLTDADGLFTLTGLPSDSDIVLTVEKNGYLPSVKLMHMPTTNAFVPLGIGLVREADLPTTDGELDLKSNGVLDFFVFDSSTGASVPAALPGVKVTLSPETEARPLYQASDGTYDASLRATPQADGFTGGLFLNVPPGDYKLSFTPPGGYTCHVIGYGTWGVAVEGEQAIRLTVRAGYFSPALGMDCFP
jgi:hypothetical protein